MSLSNLDNLINETSLNIKCNTITANSVITEAIGITNLVGTNNYIGIYPDGNPGPVNPPVSPADVVIQRASGGCGLEVVSDYNQYLSSVGFVDINDNTKNGGMSFSRVQFGQDPPFSILAFGVDNKLGIYIEDNTPNPNVRFSGDITFDNPPGFYGGLTNVLALDPSSKVVQTAITLPNVTSGQWTPNWNALGNMGGGYGSLSYFNQIGNIVTGCANILSVTVNPGFCTGQIDVPVPASFTNPNQVVGSISFDQVVSTNSYILPYGSSGIGIYFDSANYYSTSSIFVMFQYSLV